VKSCVMPSFLPINPFMSHTPESARPAH